MTVAFALKTESTTAYTVDWRVTWFVVSCVFMGIANYTWFNGWTRYVRVKDVCTIEDVREAELQMARDGLGFKRLRILSLFLAGCLIVTTVLYWWYGTMDQIHID